MLDINLIQFPDIVNPCIIPGNALGTNQFIIEETLLIPEEKPEVEHVNQVKVNLEITDSKVVFIKDCRCGELALKVIIKGILREKVIYTACTPDQSVHSAEFTRPFYGFVPLEFDFDLRGKDSSPCFLGQTIADLLNIHFCFEDIAIDKVHGRKLIKFTTILVCVSGDLDEIIATIC